MAKELAAVSVTYLVKSKGPIGLQRRSSNYRLVLLHDVRRLGTCEGEEVDDTSKRLERESVSSLRVHDVHSVGVAEEGTVGLSRGAQANEEGVGGVEVGVELRGSHVPRPHGGRAALGDDRAIAPGLFPKSEELIVAFERGAELEVLISKVEGSARIEDDRPVNIFNSESERRLGIIESERRVVDRQRRGGIAGGHDGFGNLPATVGRGGDLHPGCSFGCNRESEGEGRKIGGVGVGRRIGGGQGGGERVPVGVPRRILRTEGVFGGVRVVVREDKGLGRSGEGNGVYQRRECSPTSRNLP